MSKRPPVLAAALYAAIVFAPAAHAAVLCQKGKAVKLRADACKAKETPVGSVGDGGLPGIWERTGGTFQTYDEMTARYLVLNPDGSGELTASYGPILSCVTLNYARNTNATLTVDDSGWLVGNRIYRVAQDGAELELTDPTGATAVFSRASSVDPDADCESLVETARFTGLPEPDDNTGLAFDGTDLWYTEEDGARLVSVSPETGERGIDLPLTYTYVHAAQGADFWTHCNCGGNDDAYRLSRPGTTVDTVESETELNEELSIESLAFQASTGTLWLSGWNEADVPRLMKVDASGEPDVLVEAFDFPVGLGAMTFSGNELWALNEWNQTVLRIDPATGQLTGTFVLPDRAATWRAIAAVGNQLVFVGVGGTPAGANLREKRARGASLAGGGKGAILVVQKP